MTVDPTPALWTLLPGRPPDSDLVELVGDGDAPSAFDVASCAAASVSAAVTALSALAITRGLPVTPVAVDRRHAIAAFGSHLEIAGETPPMWSELSGYYPTADDRLIQFHCNFPHHGAGVVARLSCAPSREAVEAAVRTWQSDELEAALIADGMVAAKLRTLDEWAGHPHAVATADLPVISYTQIGDAPPRDRPTPEDGAAEGVRVLDCSRVLAGPVCGRTLAAHGADVLRVGSPELPSVPGAVVLTGFGKRNAFVDLDDRQGVETFRRLFGSADVWVDAFRPGALAHKGFTPERAADENPGVVIVELSAFDWVGPWAGRRGFDSIVQSTTGIVDAGTTAAGADRPVPLPVQALDYATGYLAAATAARLLDHQSRVGGSWLARLSLIRTRNWLVSLGGPSSFVPGRVKAAADLLQTVDSSFGTVTAVKPVAGRWDLPPSKLGSSPPIWLERPQTSN